MLSGGQELVFRTGGLLDLNYFTSFQKPVNLNRSPIEVSLSEPHTSRTALCTALCTCIVHLRLCMLA